jgi:serine/threonine protein kinase
MSDSHENTGFLAPEASHLAPLFPGYDILELIATGGMGAVFLAVQKSLERKVALKILPIELSKDAAFCAGFEAEAKAMARLNHPNLIGVYDFGEAGGMLYIIMEYVPGQSLYHSAYHLAIDPGEVIRLITGICNGLGHAHENGIIHRDIKPANILLDLNAQPKIGDFGLARPVERKPQEGEEIFGTPHYTAPEVVAAPQTVDNRADIFSVGVMLHELLTGKLPADDPRPASVIAHCDPRFDAIIRRATQPAPAARYASAREISDELQVIARPLAAKAPGVARMPPPRPVANRSAHPLVPPRKAAGIPSWVPLLLAAVGAIAGILYVQKKPPETPAAPPVASAPPAAPEKRPPTAPIVEEPEPEVPLSPTTLPEPARPPEPSIEPLPAMKVATKPTLKPAPLSQASPKSDVKGFFERARKIMLDLATPLVATHQAKLGDNFKDFERALLREARKLKIDRDSAAEAVLSACADWRRDGGRIPAYPKASLRMLPEMEALTEKYTQKQAEADQEIQQSLSQLSATYILGLEKQIERLKLENDPVAVALIEREIKLTREDSDYFSSLMRAARTTTGSSSAE